MGVSSQNIVLKSSTDKYLIDNLIQKKATKSKAIHIPKISSPKSEVALISIKEEFEILSYL